MKICCIAGSLQVGGAPKQLLNIAKYFQKKKVVFDLFLGNGGNDFRDEYGAVLNNLSVYYLTEKNKKVSRFQLLLRTPQIIFRLHRYTKNAHYDMFLGGHEFYSFYLSTFLAIVYHKKNVLLIQNNLMESLSTLNIFSQMLHRILLRFSLRHSHKIICVSRGLANSVETAFRLDPKNLVVIYDGIDITTIKKTRNDKNILRKSGISKKDKVVIACGRLVSNKDHELLIRSFALVIKKIPEAKLLIIGKGVLQKTLESLIFDLGLTESVFLLGYVRNQYSVMKCGDIFALPSKYEGFGLVLVEAMVCGLPVISMDCTYGPQEIIKESYISYSYQTGKGYKYEKYGILVSEVDEGGEVRKQERMSEAIVDLLTNKEKMAEYKKIGSERAKDFTINTMGKQYLSLLSDLLS